jgi:hypothetical protein
MRPEENRFFSPCLKFFVPAIGQLERVGRKPVSDPRGGLHFFLEGKLAFGGIAAGVLILGVDQTELLQLIA